MPTILTIPSTDIYTVKGIDDRRFFKVKLDGCTHAGMDINLARNARTTLEFLAKIQGIPQPYKLKKAALLQAVTEYIRFEIE